VLGGRFEIVAPLGSAVLGDAFRATDRKTGKTIALRILPRTSFTTGPDVEALRQAIRLASTLTHKNVCATFGMGIDPGGVKFVATELVEGQSLRAVLEERRANGAFFRLHGAYNIVALVCNAIGYAQTKLAHGGLSPESVLVSRSGRIKVADFGVLAALPAGERVRILGGQRAAAYLAPEVAAQGAAPSPAGDVWSIGVLLFELCAGRLPVSTADRLSAAVPGLPTDVDVVVARALAPDPGQRFEAAADLKAALHAVVSAMPADAAGREEADGIDVEVDVEPTGEQRAALPVPAAPAPALPPAAPRPAFPAPPAPARGLPAPPASRPAPTAAAPVEPPRRVGARMAVDEPVRASIPSAPAPDSAQVVDLAALLGEITAHDAERWMVQKDKLDHGPFSARELVQQIMQGEVLEDHVVVNMDSGERKKLRAWGEFKHFAEEYRDRKAKQDAQEALAKSVQTEKHGIAAKFVIMIVVLVAIAGGLGIYFWSRQTAGTSAATPDQLADLFAAGRIEIKGNAGILPVPRGGFRRGPGRPGGGGARPGAGGGALSYEDAMNQAVDLGNVEQGGGEQTLTAAQVAGTMNGNVRRFARCIGVDPSVRSVSMSLAIAGSGSIVGVSVSSGSPAFKQCVASTARGIRMPPFSAPRMGASYSFSW
jgi:serine/threonine-protein kinase